MTDEKKYAQISNESIQAWAETVGITDLSTDVLRTLGADATYRIHQILNVCNKYLSHSYRRKLTSDDFNRALKLMDVAPVNGYSGSEAIEYVSVPELGVYVTHDPPVNLASTALSGDIFHQPGNTYVKGKWGHVSGHVITESENNSEEKCLSTLPLSPHLIQYYRKVFYVTSNPSVKLFEIMCEDLASSTNIGAIIGPIIKSCLKGVQKANQKPVILRRLLLIIKALLINSHIHLGHENHMQELVNVLVFSVVTEKKGIQDTNSLRILAANILIQLARKEGESGRSWDLSVSSLSGVIGGGPRPWTQHAGALIGLISLGTHALYRALMPIIAEYFVRICHALATTPLRTRTSGILAKDTIDLTMIYGLLMVGFVNMMVGFTKSLPDKQNLHLGKAHLKGRKSSKREEAIRDDLVKKITEVYSMGEEMFGSSFVLQVPPVYLYSGDTPASFEVSRYPRRESLYDETFLSEYTSSKLKNTPPVTISNPKERQIITTAEAFDDTYHTITPLEKRKIYMCIRGCSTRKFEFLKHKKSSLPEVKHHRYRQFLISHGKPRLIGRMPHWTFIRPLLPPERPCSSLNYLIL